MQAGRPAGLEKSQTELRLGQGLAAGQGHAAARLFVKNAVFLNFGKDIGDGVLSAGDLKRLIHAGLGTFSAGVALGTVDDDRPFIRTLGKSLLRADFEAGVTAGAAGRAQEKLKTAPYAFRIMAPQAMQGAALEKYCRPDAWAVMNREPLDVENQALRRTGRFLLFRAFHWMAFFAYEISMLQFISNGNISHIKVGVKSPTSFPLWLSDPLSVAKWALSMKKQSPFRTKNLSSRLNKPAVPDRNPACPTAFAGKMHEVSPQRP